MAKQANPGKHPETDITTSDRLWQATSFGLPLLLYIVTLAPTVTLEDSGSFITAAKFLGVAHPSGYPLWCLIAHAFTWLPFGGIAERVHLCSAFFAAATCWLVYLTAVMLTSRRISALLAALALGISRIFWSQAVIAEVYTLNAFFTILLIHLTLRWQLTQENRWLFLLAFTSGLALTNHPKIILVVPVVWVWALWSHWRRVLVPRVLFVIGLLIVLGLSVYLYLPLRARSDPPVNWHKPDTLAKTLNHIQRASYFAPEEGVRYLGGTSDVVRHTLTAWKTSATAVSWPLAIIALFGLIHTWRQRRDFALLSLALFLLHTFLFNAYVHATYSDVWRFAHRVYYIPAHVMTSLWIAFGLAVIEGWLRNRLQHSVRLSGLARRNWLVAGLFLALVLVPLIQNYSHAGHRGDQRARNFGLDFVSVLPRGAGILPVGDTVVTTACDPSSSAWANRTFCASGSGSAALNGGTSRPTS